MSKRKNVIRVGDKVKIVNPEVFVRTGYPLTTEMIKESHITEEQKHDHSVIHHSAGMAMRNEWHLWDKKSKISKDIQKRFQLCHGDDLSGLINTALWAKVKGEGIDKALIKCAKRYKKHWKDSGVDAMTGEPLPNRKEQKSMSISIKLKKDGTIEIV